MSKSTLDVAHQLVAGYQIPGSHPQLVQLAQTISQAREELKAALQGAQEVAGAPNGQAAALEASPPLRKFDDLDH